MRPAKGRLGSKMGNCLVELPRSEIERANALDDTSTPDLDAALHEKLKGLPKGFVDSWNPSAPACCLVLRVVDPTGSAVSRLLKCRRRTLKTA